MGDHVAWRRLPVNHTQVSSGGEYNSNTRSNTSFVYTPMQCCDFHGLVPQILPQNYNIIIVDLLNFHCVIVVVFNHKHFMSTIILYRLI